MTERAKLPPRFELPDPHSLVRPTPGQNELAVLGYGDGLDVVVRMAELYDREGSFAGLRCRGLARAVIHRQQREAGYGEEADKPAPPPIVKSTPLITTAPFPLQRSPCRPLPLLSVI